MLTAQGVKRSRTKYVVRVIGCQKCMWALSKPSYESAPILNCHHSFIQVTESGFAGKEYALVKLQLETFT